MATVPTPATEPNPTTNYPEYVTDGFHIYLWHPEYASMFDQGKLKASDPPPAVEAPPLSPEDMRTLEERRKQAVRDAELTIKQYGPRPEGKPVSPASMEAIFGSEPRSVEVPEAGQVEQAKE